MAAVFFGDKVGAEVVQSFELKNDERPFVEELLRRKSNLWVFRTNQRRFCGDFIVVDMSHVEVCRRPVLALDLKQNARVKTGGGGAGIQFRNVPHALDAIAVHTRVIPRDSPYAMVTGDSRLLLEFFGA